MKAGGIRKALKAYVDFVYCEAPHNVAGAFGTSQSIERAGLQEQQRNELGWWVASESNTRPSQSLYAAGADESIETIRRACEDEGPFDGLFCFSQGCAVGALALAELAGECVRGDGFALMVAGFLPWDQSLRDRVLQNSPLPYNALVVSGSNDALVERSRTEELGECFKSCELHYHNGGHGIPSDSDFRSKCKRFITDHFDAEEGG
jgi:predicted esterase